MTGITSGNGVNIGVEYSLLTDEHVYTPDHDAIYPRYDFVASLSVVSAYETSNGIGGMNRVSYTYSGAEMNLRGRGFRGFKTVTMTSDVTGISTETTYSQNHIDTGARILEVVQRLSNGDLISRVTNKIGHNFTYDSSVFFAYVAESTAESYELGSPTTPYQVTTTTNELDSDGNLIRQELDYGDGFKEVIVNRYNDNYNSWFLGRLTEAEVTKQAPGRSTVTRRSTFAYHPQTGLLVEERSNPDHPDVEIVKTYEHDPYGNIIVSTTDGQSFNSRSLETTYSALGRFVIETRNSLGHSERSKYDPILGTIQHMTGPNGLTTYWHYDGFGRQLEESRPDGTSTVTAYRRCTAKCPPLAEHYVWTQSSGSQPAVVYLDMLDREIKREVIGFNGAAIVTDNVYNEHGQVEKRSDPYFIEDSPLWTVPYL